MSLRTLAIDSGYPRCACADTEKCLIRHVGYAGIYAGGGIPGWVRAAEPYDRAIVEIPTMRGAATPNPEDLILVAVAGARLAQRFVSCLRNLREVRPSEWKGNTPKPAHHLRTLWPALTTAERKLLGGAATLKAIKAACLRGATARWSKPGASYYHASEMPTVDGQKMTHDLLDAAALALYDLGRISK